MTSGPERSVMLSVETTLPKEMWIRCGLLWTMGVAASSLLPVTDDFVERPCFACVSICLGSILCLEVGALTCDLCRCRSLKQVYMFNQGHWSINIDLFVWRSTFYSYLCVCFLMPHCTHILVHIQNQILPEYQAWMILDAYEGPEGHVMVSWGIMSVLHLSTVPCITNNELFVSGWCHTHIIIIYYYYNMILILFYIFTYIYIYIFMFIFHLVIHVSIFSKKTVLVALH